MADADDFQTWTAGQLEARVVRYTDLQPCYNAFIDCRSPGSEAKENFTIIGPGVSENAAQHVHIAEPHGFNIGGARQPPHCVNSQHSHDTAEVFVVHTGQWRFDLGERGEDAQAVLGPGDTISLPTGVFRGFTNIGNNSGFLWAVLGGDDPGRVTWAPQVFEMARDFGLVLLENGSLIDTAAGEMPPADATPMAPTTAEQAARLRHVSPAEAEAGVARDAPGKGWRPVIGDGGPIANVGGFTLARLDVDGGQTVGADTPQVLFVHRGSAAVEWPGGSLTLGEGDTITIPASLGDYRLASANGATLFAARRA